MTNFTNKIQEIMDGVKQDRENSWKEYMSNFPEEISQLPSEAQSFFKMIYDDAYHNGLEHASRTILSSAGLSSNKTLDDIQKLMSTDQNVSNN